VPKVGDTIVQKSHPWWKVPRKGKVMSVRMDGFSTRVRAQYQSRLKPGDKLSTPHGQKGIAVLTSNIPRGIDSATNRPVTFDVCSSAVSIINRVSPGQVMEGQQDRCLDGAASGVCNVVSNGAVVMSASNTNVLVMAP
jgi:hypothetical protein